jgi:hypothetical protein
MEVKAADGKSPASGLNALSDSVIQRGRVTSIQKLLGHRSLDSTLIYARVYDQTVSVDYYTAMARIEKSLNLTPEAEAPGVPLPAAKHAQLLELVSRLAAPQLGVEMRLELVEQIRCALNGKTMEQAVVLSR